MAHKKEIYTTVIKALPHTNCFIDRNVTADTYNALAAAFYHLFNSDILTKGDYIHIFGVLTEKFPVYEKTADKEKYKELSVSYATFGYPPNPDLSRVISDFIDSIGSIPTANLRQALYTILTRLKDSSDFVGTELHARGFTLTPITEKELATIQSIILVK